MTQTTTDFQFTRREIMSLGEIAYHILQGGLLTIFVRQYFEQDYVDLETRLSQLDVNDPRLSRISGDNDIYELVGLVYEEVPIRPDQAAHFLLMHADFLIWACYKLGLDRERVRAGLLQMEVDDIRFHHPIPGKELLPQLCDWAVRTPA